MDRQHAVSDKTFYEAKAEIQQEAKLAVALRAVIFLAEGDALLIDAGTSLTPMAKIIRAMSADYFELCHHTIMTHNQDAFTELVESEPKARLNVFQTGGRYDRDLNASFGRQAERAYEEFDPKWVFIGQSGLDADRGLFCHGNTEELSLKQVIFSKPAFARVILSDYGKLGIPGGLRFGESNRLRDNVEHCILLTSDPRDEPKDYPSSDEPREERYERQITKLSETHGVSIIPVKWSSHYCHDTGRTRISLDQALAPPDKPRWMGIEHNGTNWLEYESDEERKIKILKVEIEKFAAKKPQK